MDIEEVLKNLENIKEIGEKKRYLDRLIKKTKDKDLKTKLNDVLNGLKAEEKQLIEKEEPEEIIEEEFESVTKKFQKEEVEPLAEEETFRPTTTLETRVEESPVEREEKRPEYFLSPAALYESTVIEDTPLLSNIKKDLKTRGIWREDMFFGQEQINAVRETIDKYSPSLSEETKNNYTNLLTHGSFKKYEQEFMPTTVSERITLEERKAKEKYTVKHLEGK